MSKNNKPALNCRQKAMWYMHCAHLGVKGNPRRRELCFNNHPGELWHAPVFRGISWAKGQAASAEGQDAPCSWSGARHGSLNATVTRFQGSVSVTHHSSGCPQDNDGTFWVIFPFMLRFAVTGKKCDGELTALGVETRNKDFQNRSLLHVGGLKSVQLAWFKRWVEITRREARGSLLAVWL